MRMDNITMCGWTQKWTHAWCKLQRTTRSVYLARVRSHERKVLQKVNRNMAKQWLYTFCTVAICEHTHTHRELMCVILLLKFCGYLTARSVSGTHCTMGWLRVSGIHAKSVFVTITAINSPCEGWHFRWIRGGCICFAAHTLRLIRFGSLRILLIKSSGIRSCHLSMQRARGEQAPPDIWWSLIRLVMDLEMWIACEAFNHFQWSICHSRIGTECAMPRFGHGILHRMLPCGFAHPKTLWHFSCIHRGRIAASYASCYIADARCNLPRNAKEQTIYLLFYFTSFVIILI